MERLDALEELLSRLLAQDHDSYEIIVVEQTPSPSTDALERVMRHWRHEQVRVLRAPPSAAPAPATGAFEQPAATSLSSSMMTTCL